MNPLLKVLFRSQKTSYSIIEITAVNNVSHIIFLSWYTCPRTKCRTM